MLCHHIIKISLQQTAASDVRVGFFRLLRQQLRVVAESLRRFDCKQGERKQAGPRRLRRLSLFFLTVYILLWVIS